MDFSHRHLLGAPYLTQSQQHRQPLPPKLQGPRFQVAQARFQVAQARYEWAQHLLGLLGMLALSGLEVESLALACLPLPSQEPNHMGLGTHDHQDSQH